ncbi:uncharacterized protein LOC116024196 [Ipomoea triloba]|uniref:uncharacterized protein LOC116024196 n=1 Tax=Ipomoea triloba TaxID=35885 RepID=UPI00125D1BEE|nr:uncharacterized protein LOC116024196 [Ipomoea triloba]
MIFITWNCQGAASREVLRALKEIKKTYKPDLLGLLETKVSGSKADEICNRLGFDEWLRVEALGFSGGIWVFWNSTLDIKPLLTHPQFVLLHVQGLDCTTCFISIVYGSPTHALRKNLWNSLDMHDLQIRGPWLVAGDFNAVISPEEVSEPRNFSHSRSTGFRDWIFNQNLIDLGFQGS